ncbi:MAG: hypothetical protein HQL94_11120, partial [Magnetococcales bacterium]|nr:hypothetical protein [Magnetococcales bacterium]
NVIFSVVYSFVNWLNDSDVTKESRLYLKSLVVRSPLLEGLNEFQDQAAGSEFFFDGQKAEGLGVALMTNISPS